MSRRSLLTGGLAVVGATSVTGLASLVATARPPLADPFTLGVASGDPTPDGVVLWTRLAADPLAADGLGGLTADEVVVDWQLAQDERFSRVVRSGRAYTGPRLGYAVHVELAGLPPAAAYFYRFRTGGYLSPVGRTRTAPAPGTTVALRMAFASCANFEQGFFTAYRHLAEEQPELIVNLGDYIYEYPSDVYVAASGNVRDVEGLETTTLAGYRQRYAQYKTDPDLQAAHAVAPWVAVLDDHEVVNNWADDISSPGASTAADFVDRRAAAFRAYYENLPLRRASMPRGPTMQLYRRIAWGDLATFHLLDTRQYRDPHACRDYPVPCEEPLDRRRTITGARQERWLLEGLADSRTTWNIIGNQVFFSQRDKYAGPIEAYSRDAWDGYAVQRDRIVAQLRSRRVRNPVILTGDIHLHYACDVLADFADPGSPVVATELVGTSITSNGDGGANLMPSAAQVADNPHIHYSDDRRGYVSTTITPDAITAKFRVLDYVSRPGAPRRTGATFVVESDRPGLQLP